MTWPLRVVFFGVPTAGKSTISWMVAERLGIRQIALGQLLRTRPDAPPAHDGALLPDDDVIPLVAGELALATRGFILDGFPRTAGQLAWLESHAGGPCRYLFLDLDRDSVRERFLARANCPACRMADYQAGNGEPRVCSRCGGPLRPRNDANEEACRRKLEEFDRQERPLVQRLEAAGALERIAVTGDAEADTRLVLARLQGSGGSTDATH